MLLFAMADSNGELNSVNKTSYASALTYIWIGIPYMGALFALIEIVVLPFCEKTKNRAPPVPMALRNLDLSVK
jgi:hypothetical protein